MAYLVSCLALTGMWLILEKQSNCHSGETRTRSAVFQVERG